VVRATPGRDPDPERTTAAGNPAAVALSLRLLRKLYEASGSSGWCLTLPETHLPNALRLLAFVP
jgi:hypothetical protein